MDMADTSSDKVELERPDEVGEALLRTESHDNHAPRFVQDEWRQFRPGRACTAAVAFALVLALAVCGAATAIGKTSQPNRMGFLRTGRGKLEAKFTTIVTDEDSWRPGQLEAKFTTIVTDEEARFCSSSQSLPGPVQARKLEPTGEWAEKCLNEWHDGRWIPPPQWGEDAKRNWCWVYMKQQAEIHRFDAGMNGKPPNWWGAQAAAAGNGNAPDPWQQVLPALINHEVCDQQPNGATVSNEQLSPYALPPSAWKDAKDWFNENVQVFVINLPQNTERLANIKGRLDQLGVSFTRLDGVVLSGAGLQNAKRSGLVPQAWNLDVANSNLKLQYGDSPSVVGQFGLGTAGCTAAHLRAMKNASHSTKPLALILEDDSYLLDEFFVKLRAILRDEVPCDWQAINLNLFMPYGECISPHLARVHPDGNEPIEVCRKGANWSFAAMLYKVAHLGPIIDQLSNVVWNTARPACLVHDMAFSTLADRIAYYGVPAHQQPGLVSKFEVGNDVSREDVNR